MNHNLNIPPFPTLRTAWTLAILTIAVSAAIAIACTAIDRTDQVIVALTVGGACGAGSLLGLWPIHRLTPRRVDGAGVGFLVGIGPRLVITLAAAMLIVKLTDQPAQTVAAWTAGWYLLLLAVETSLVARYLNTRRLPQPLNTEVPA